MQPRGSTVAERPPETLGWRAALFSGVAAEVFRKSKGGDCWSFGILGPVYRDYVEVVMGGRRHKWEPRARTWPAPPWRLVKKRRPRGRKSRSGGPALLVKFGVDQST